MTSNSVDTKFLADHKAMQEAVSLTKEELLRFYLNQKYPGMSEETVQSIVLANLNVFDEQVAMLKKQMELEEATLDNGSHPNTSKEVAPVASFEVESRPPCIVDDFVPNIKWEELCRGAGSKVYKAQAKASSKSYAIKIVHDDGSQKRKDSVKYEYECSEQLRQNKNVVQCYGHGYFEQAKFFWLVFELCEDNIADLMPICNDMTEVVEVFPPIVNALVDCASKGIVHRGLSLDHILIAEDGTIKLANFGSAVKTSDDHFTEYDALCDCWELGCLLYQLMYGNESLILGKSFKKAVVSSEKDLEKVYKESLKKMFEKFDDVNFGPANDLVRQLLQWNPQDRPSIHQVRQIDWVAKSLE